MKKNMSLILLTVIISLSSFADSKSDLRKKLYESLPSCDQAVFTNDQYLAVSLTTQMKSLGHVRLFSLDNPNDILDLPAKNRIVDLKIENETLYILTQTTFEAWDLKQKKALFAYASHPQVNSHSSWRQVASGFVVKNNFAFITHGVLGLSVIDLSTGQFVQVLPPPTVSSLQDIALVDAKTALIAVDNDDEGQFRGLYQYDLTTLTITKKIKIDNALPSAIRVLDNNRLMMIYFNAVWKFDLNQVLKSSSEPSPQRRAWKFPNLFLVDMVGKVAFDDKNLYACFKTMDEKTGAREIAPLAFDLETLKLK